jgi:hypothetical protein
MNPPFLLDPAQAHNNQVKLVCLGSETFRGPSFELITSELKRQEVPLRPEATLRWPSPWKENYKKVIIAFPTPVIVASFIVALM